MGPEGKDGHPGLQGLRVCKLFYISEALSILSSVHVRTSGIDDSDDDQCEYQKHTKALYFFIKQD